MEQQIKLLKAVEDTLEKVEVRGRENLDRMLGCMGTLQSVRQNLIKLEKEMKKDAEGGTTAEPKRNSEGAAAAV
jgi:hypothetical protein